MRTLVHFLEFAGFMIALNLIAQLILPTFKKDNIGRRISYRFVVFGIIGVTVLVGFIVGG